MIAKIFGIHSAVNKYSNSAYSQPSFHFYGYSVIKFCEGTQQVDPESPALFSDSIRDRQFGVEKKLMVP